MLTSDRRLGNRLWFLSRFGSQDVWANWCGIPLCQSFDSWIYATLERRWWHGKGSLPFRYWQCAQNVTPTGFELEDIPHRFEAGTPQVVQVIGFSAAIDFLRNIGLSKVPIYTWHFTYCRSLHMNAILWTTCLANYARSLLSTAHLWMLVQMNTVPSSLLTSKDWALLTSQHYWHHVMLLWELVSDNLSKC